MEQIHRLFSALDEKFGPSKVTYQPACQDVREMLIECVMESDCMKAPDAKFRYSVWKYNQRNCIRQDINKECKAIRYDYQLCRKS